MVMVNAPQYKNLAALTGLTVILILSSMGADRYNKNKEDNKGMMTFSVIGIVFSVFSIIGLGMYINPGGRTAMMLSEE